MATITYYGSFERNTAGASGLSARVSGQALPTYATLRSIRFTLDISAAGYASTKNWQLLWFAIGSDNGSPYAEAQTKKMSSGAYTFEGSMIFAQSDVDKFTSGSFEVYAKANTTHSSTSYMGDFAITVEYDNYTRCTAPTEVTIAKSITAAATNVLSWGGMTAGMNNEISGFFIQYADSTDNVNFGEWAELNTVGVVFSTDVAMPADNTYRKYKVWTLGAAGTNWRSSSGTESSGSTYRGHAEIAGFTDSPLVVGVTHVKALHMQELQDRANLLRDFYGLSAYKFSTITAGETGLKDWTAHVNEIRSAVDEITKKHAEWIAFSVNCPRADVIEQLRAVILAL